MSDKGGTGLDDADHLSIGAALLLTDFQEIVAQVGADIQMLTQLAKPAASGLPQDTDHGRTAGSTGGTEGREVSGLSDAVAQPPSRPLPTVAATAEEQNAGSRPDGKTDHEPDVDHNHEIAAPHSAAQAVPIPAVPQLITDMARPAPEPFVPQPDVPGLRQVAPDVRTGVGNMAAAGPADRSVGMASPADRRMDCNDEPDRRTRSIAPRISIQVRSLPGSGLATVPPPSGAVDDLERTSAAAFSPLASAVPPPAREQGPIGGDVFLDGVKVGRWMSNLLAQELGGPARGSTGFDPRMGPSWPGTLQGAGL